MNDMRLAIRQGIERWKVWEAILSVAMDDMELEIGLNNGSTYTNGHFR